MPTRASKANAIKNKKKMSIESLSSIETSGSHKEQTHFDLCSSDDEESLVDYSFSQQVGALCDLETI